MSVSNFDQHISNQQAGELSRVVKEVATTLSKKCGRNEYRSVYVELYRKFGIASYKLLPARRFQEAIDWLTEWSLGITTNSTSVGSMTNAASEEMLSNRNVEQDMGKGWDVFICHASEDKVSVVEPLVQELRARGLKVWYDRWVLRIGDSLRRMIDSGLSQSRYGIVMLSPAFFKKQWPQWELDGLVQRENMGVKVILPVWHNVTHEVVAGYSPSLADKMAGSTTEGILPLVEQLIEAIVELPGEESESRGPYLANDEALLFLAPEVISKQIIDSLEAQRLVSIKRNLRSAVELFFRHINEISPGSAAKVTELKEKKLLPILDSLITMGITFIEYEEWKLFSETQKAFYSICRQAQKSTFPAHSEASPTLTEEWIWREVMIRVYTLGAVLVNLSHWEQARELVQQEIDWEEYYRSFYWSRYIAIMSSRAGLLDKTGWTKPTVDYIQSNEWLAKLFIADKDEVTAAVCQFDFLQCVYVTVNNSGDVGRAYPSFGAFYKYRTEPIIAKLITPGRLRNTVAQVSDEQLARIIDELNILTKEVMPLVHGWNADGWSNPKIRQFLAATGSQDD